MFFRRFLFVFMLEFVSPYLSRFLVFDVQSVMKFFFFWSSSLIQNLHISFDFLSSESISWVSIFIVIRSSPLFLLSASSNSISFFVRLCFNNIVRSWYFLVSPIICQVSHLIITNDATMLLDFVDQYSFSCHPSLQWICSSLFSCSFLR